MSHVIIKKEKGLVLEQFLSILLQDYVTHVEYWCCKFLVGPFGISYITISKSLVDPIHPLK